MNKILTIVIPTYNMEKYLDKCLSSLIVSPANMQQLEVLVINDGSKDNSSKIGHSYEERYPGIFRVIDKENGNYGSCVNRGLKEATGKYIKVLDADDSFDVEIFELYISYLQRLDADLIISDYKVVDEKGQTTETYTFPLPTDRLFNLGDLTIGTIRWLWHHGVTYRTEMVRGINYHQTEGISYTDDEWIFCPMRKVKQVSYFPYFLYLYLRGREGQTFDPKVLKKAFHNRIIVGKKMLNDYALHQSECSQVIKNYLFTKLVEKLRVIYTFYLIKHASKDGLRLLKDLDSLVRDSAPDIYSSLGKIQNKAGWRYIDNWRVSGYKQRTAMLQVLRFKFKLYSLMNMSGSSIKMPASLKRQS